MTVALGLAKGHEDARRKLGKISPSFNGTSPESIMDIRVIQKGES